MEKTSESANKNLFVITPSKNAECFTVTTPTIKAWEITYQLLTDQYTFKLNGNGSQTTTTSAEGQKVVLTLFNSSHKLLIQGLGCKLWKDSVLKELSSKVNSKISNSQINPTAANTELDKQCEEIIPNSQPLRPKVSGNKSPGNIFSKLFGITSMPKTPKTPRTPVNYMGLTREEQFEYIRQRTPKYRLNTPVNYSPLNSHIKKSDRDSDKNSICSEDVILTSVDGAPISSEKCLSDLNGKNVECLSLSETESIVCTENTNLKTPECSGPDKQVEYQSCEQQQEPEEATDHGKIDKDYIKELEMCQKELTTIKKENKDLQHQFKEFLTQSKLLRTENEKLIQDMESEKAKSKKASESLEKEVQQCEKYKNELKSVSENYQKEIRSFSAKLADETALALTLEEENKKLKSKLDKMSKEKAELIGQMSRSTGTTDMLEGKIEDLTDLFLKEMSELRLQFEKSVVTTGSTGILPSNTNLEQQPPQNGSSRNDTQEERTPMEADTDLPPSDQHNHSVFIAGDSVTSILSKNKMSNTNLEFSIRSHSCGKLQDIHNTIIAMAEDEDEYICNTNAVIIHAGTNNLSDGDSVDDIVKQNKNIALTIQQINPDCRIIVSLILPRKNDKLANKVIEQTNECLRQLCDTNSFVFLDSKRNFTSDCQTNVSLYKDNLHLNAKGGKVFGESICRTVQETLKLPAHNAQNTTIQEQSFRNGRIPGRRTTDNRSNYNNTNTNNRGNNNRRSNNNRGSNNNKRGSSNNNNNKGNNRQQKQQQQYQQHGQQQQYQQQGQRSSFRMFVRSFVRSFVRTSFRRVEFASKFCVKVSQVVYISATTKQKAFIFGP